MNKKIGFCVLLIALLLVPAIASATLSMQITTNYLASTGQNKIEAKISGDSANDPRVYSAVISIKSSYNENSFDVAYREKMTCYWSYSDNASNCHYYIKDGINWGGTAPVLVEAPSYDLNKMSMVKVVPASDISVRECRQEIGGAYSWCDSPANQELECGSSGGYKFMPQGKYCEGSNGRLQSTCLSCVDYTISAKCETKFGSGYKCGDKITWQLECNGNGKLAYLPSGTYCMEGNLIQNTCYTCGEVYSDTDNGLDYYTQGTCTGYNLTNSDYCGTGSMEGYLTEYYLSNNACFASSYKCPYSCKDGACLKESETCKDSDGGINYYLKGTETSNGQTFTDYCSSDGTQLAEFYCAPGHSITWYTCPYGCEDGACKQPKCTETDNGLDYYNAGYASYGQTKYYDSCTYNTSTGTYTLYESYCASDTTASTQKYQCPSKCENGACIKQECIDTDSGLNKYTVGYVSYRGQRYKDYCGREDDGSVILVEQFCRNDTPQSESFSCEYGCSDGACASIAPSCKDTDPNNDEFTKGNVYGIQQGNAYSVSDYCYSGTAELVEYNCDKNAGVDGPQYYRQVKTCKYGCQDGACIKYDQPDCLENDNGVDPMNYGACVSKTGTFKDYCRNERELMESACNQGECEYELTECVYGCANGECIKKTDIYEENTLLQLALNQEIKLRVEGYVRSVFLLETNQSSNPKTCTIKYDNYKYELYEGIPFMYYNENHGFLAVDVGGENCAVLAFNEKIGSCTDSDKTEFTVYENGGITYPPGEDRKISGKIVVSGSYIAEDKCANEVIYSDGINENLLKYVPAEKGTHLLEMACANKQWPSVAHTPCKSGCINGKCVDNNCVGAGVTGHKSKGEECCSGLEPMPNWKPIGGTCETSDSDGFVCTQCGDGTCGTGENWCNCGVDCVMAECQETDSGKDYYSKGTITATNTDGTIDIKTDYCGTGENSNTLTEWYCAPSQLSANNTKPYSFKEYPCEKGCADGACVELAECAKEGEQFSKVYTENYPATCCEGLKEWESGMDTRISVEGKCYYTGLVSGWPVGICLACGNGTCDKLENPCNCPEDCKENSTYKTVQEFCERAYTSYCNNPAKSKELCALCETTKLTARIDIYNGWNLISFPGSMNYIESTQPNGVPKVMEYNPIKKEYKPAKTVEMGKAYWVYNAGEYFYAKGTVISPIPTSQADGLAKGWNFVPVLTDMIGKRINDFDCKVIGSFYYDAKAKEWVKMFGVEIKEEHLGKALAVKVLEECELKKGTGGNGGNPPSLPN